MLSENTIQIIKSTVPVLSIHGTAITTRFYELLFTNHPELLHVFNHANQKQGKQQAALANAVYAAALHIDNLAAVLPVVKQIAHKHRSLGVKEEHYPIVGKYLLAAMKDVLQEAATEEILQAWAEAYGVIAGAFIDTEKAMYEEAEQQAGGWEGFRAFVITRIVQESEVIKSFYLEPADKGALASFEPGQYVSVKLEIPGEKYTHIRQYSLSDAPQQPYYRITVKKEAGHIERPAGKVSSALHDRFKQGDVLMLSAPAGSFTLNAADRRPVVLLSGGVGLTPMISMLNTLVKEQPERPVTFIHAARNGQWHAMKEHVDALAERNQQLSVFYCYDHPNAEDIAQRGHHHEGFIDLTWLRQIVPVTDASFYFCGPTPFMKLINKLLLACGISANDIHYEFFGPAGSLEEGEEEELQSAVRS
ncbi:NO-inducible flavohemoprotein [Paenibacillaceae bacterium]|nr:NO-inducible flavohemoprotein [Paenibacillaceae bacterium]